MSRAALIAKEAHDHSLNVKSKFTITPGLEQFFAKFARDVQMKVLGNVGSLMLANPFQPCIRQWDRKDINKGDVSPIFNGKAS